MRLINVETIDLEEFLGEQIPEYAILSHTWGPSNDEVQFRDVQNPSKFQKPGYRKLKFLCRQAAKDGFAFAWCDTCCIDKASSAELSESINSMFQWYQNAAICYAYLQDVSRDRSDEHDREQLRKSRWFTRGWTLQELLAPAKVKFYDQDWALLGDKTSLFYELQAITGVNFGALSWPHAIATYSMATRMSWASQRITTRIEDQAYCMLGILGVNLPLLYGEGRKAFRRLQEEIIRNSSDETIFAHYGTNILASSVSEFSGKNLTILPKEVPGPFSMTNAGLNIHMRIKNFATDDKNADDSQVSAIGILNCHINDSTNRDSYVGVPLAATGIKNTYRKARNFIYSIPMNRVPSDYRTVFIQQEAIQVSKITLLEAYDRNNYATQKYPLSSGFASNSVSREMRIYPTPPYEFEAIYYTIQRDGSYFHFVVVFDMLQRKAGIHLISGTAANATSEPTLTGPAAFKFWKDSGRPAVGLVLIPSNGSSTAKEVRISLVQTAEMRQFVWALRIERSRY